MVPTLNRPQPPASSSGDELAGLVALVTGGGSGIGLATVRCLARQGASVVIADIDHPKAAAAAAELGGNGVDVRAHRLDVADAGDWERVVERVVGEAGGIDILVNNAGIISNDPIMATEPQVWDRVLAVNLTGVFLGMRAVAPRMRARGGGAMVNVSSFAALVGYHAAAYAASKWAVRGLSKSAADEFAAWNIRVNSLHPGSVPTAMHATTPPGHAEAWRQLIPQGRLGEADELAEAVSFLVGPRSSYVTGSELVVDGGLSSSGISRARARLLDLYAPAR